MKKIHPFLLVSLLLTGCNCKVYSFKEITGFEVSEITQTRVSSSVYQNAAWDVDEKYYSYLDCAYILVNFDIDEQFMGWPPSESKDDAICIHVETDSHNLDDSWCFAIFYISHKTHYMYAQSYEKGKCFRSKYVMPNSFIIDITTWN